MSKCATWRMENDAAAGKTPILDNLGGDFLVLFCFERPSGGSLASSRFLQYNLPGEDERAGAIMILR